MKCLAQMQLLIISCILSLAAALTIESQRRNFYGYEDFQFWYWDLGWLVWDKQCERYNKEDTVETRITGGDLAQPNMFPYQVGLLLLQAPKVLQCGGVLIAERFVLTAAHCIYRSTLGKVYLGSILFADESTSAVVYNVTAKDFQPHELYKQRGGRDDIGLVRLPASAPLSSAVQTIPLARRFMTQSLLEGKVVTASGWGRISDKEEESMSFNLRLYYLDAPVMPQQECACYYLPSLVRPRNHLCTSGANGRGTCDGDSGGPLTFFYKNQSYLVGLTAFGSAGGCEIGFPSVYTRVTTYLDWIAARTGIKVE